jgi:hypothetical protein
MAVLVIEAESGDYCGISEIFIWVTEEFTEQDSTDIALKCFLEKHGHDVDSTIFEYYEDEDWEVLGEDGGSTFCTAEWWTSELGWDWDSNAYHVCYN